MEVKQRLAVLRIFLAGRVKMRKKNKYSLLNMYLIAQFAAKGNTNTKNMKIIHRGTL